MSEHAYQIETENGNINQKRIEVENEISAHVQTKKRLQKNLNRMNKEIDDELKKRKKLEIEIVSIVNNIKELQN